jgi:hypothetical protein
MTITTKERGRTAMNRANLLTRVILSGALAASLLPGALRDDGGRSAGAKTSGQSTNGQSTTGQTPGDTATHSWTTEQAITSSVREAWALGGKTEEGFFEIVKALAAISAQKRGITLPDNQEAGKKAGEWIKKQAKKDPDQLLYVIVDHAVQYSARKTAGQ